ncbi:MAG: hypothetical protein JJV98_08605 [Desulfosarcina sp.]|nr:hypothetical protein [Desulfobacterales bacterium]
MASQDDRVVINANIEISGQTIQQIVHTAKKIKGPDTKGHYHIDTADLVSDLISRFLVDRGFEEYVADRRHYTAILPAEDAEGQ